MTEKRKPGRKPDVQPIIDTIEKIEWLPENSFQPKTNDLTEYDLMLSPFRERFTDFVSSKSSYR